jgi:uncharacterized protein YdeI (YjbR/CyaY-like superfamily)
VKTFHAKNGAEWRRWLERNHLLEQEVWLVFYRKGAEEPCVTFDEALDWALCYGWIDSMIRKIDDRRYARRFTPRRPGSVWSSSNIERAEELTREGKMAEKGMALFNERTVDSLNRT